MAQKRLLKLIAKYAQRRQIVISTHSPYFIEWEYLRNGAKINRVAKEHDIKSNIYTLKEPHTYEVLITGGNWQQPYLADVVSKEVFFQENILFLEGREDVGLLRDHFKEFDINIFGYGVRGFNGFEFALQLAADLGIKKAAVILDSPSATNTDKTLNENTVKRDLEAKFSHLGYQIIQWDKADIRDKKAFTSEEKIGYFSAKGKLKDESELGDFNMKIDRIKTYFVGGKFESH